jgi:DNA modification methylase
VQTNIEEYPVTKIDVSKLHFDESNPNKPTKEQIDAIRKSFERFGFLVPIIINENYEIGDGEHRALVYKQLGLTEIPAYIVPKINDDIERRLLRQTMNKLRGEHAIKLDAEEMALIFRNDKLQDLADLIAQQREGLESILTKYQGIQFQHEDNFDVSKTLDELVPETQLGDIWQLGQHRIMCADCTDKRSIDRLLEDKAICQLNTDPPYGVDYGSKNKFLNQYDKGNRIQDDFEGDNIAFDSREYFNNIFKALDGKWADYNTIYIWSGGWHMHQIRLAMEDSDIKWGHYLIWVKNNHVLGTKDYKAKHEFCIYGWKGKHKFYGPFRTTVLEYDKPLVNDLHPTMKPIALISQTITDGTEQGDIVLDAHLGSGTTLIACEQTSRVCYGVELDPHYVDVCVKRWEAFTKQKAERLVGVSN